MDTNYAILGCPACQTYVLNGKQRFTCRLNFNNCSQAKKCKMKQRVVSVLEYMQNSDNLEDIQVGVKEVLKYLREGN